MTKHRLQANVLLTASVLLFVIIAASISKFYFKLDDVYSTIKDFSSLIIAVGAAYLAYCFQRRQAFLVSLRDLWKDLIEAKTELLEYTNNAAPDQSAFNRAHRRLGRAIDSVRGVYRNVGETETHIGSYPFEPLHDMRRTLEELGWTDLTPERQHVARHRFIQAWNALRWAFLREFSTPEPRYAITERDAKDPRRKD